MEKYYILDEEIARIMMIANAQNYELFSKDTKAGNFTNILNNYLQNITNYKLKNFVPMKEKIISLGKHMVEHLTGDYEIGLGESTFEEQDRKAEVLTDIIAYSDNDYLESMLKNNQEKELAQIVIDGSITSGIISDLENEELQAKAGRNFDNSDEKMKAFFLKAFHNIIHLNRTIANGVAHITGMDKEESMELNHNIAGKIVGGIAYDLLSGTLVSKRHFTSVQNSKSMLKTIKDEGVLHFCSPSTAEKIMDSGKVKKSSVYISDLTAPKSFFFGGIPKFEDLLINVPAYDVMTAVRIRPTEEQMKTLKYRALNDRAVVKDGDFEFGKEQAEIAYFGLMYDKEKDSIYLGELGKEEAENFQVSEEVRKTYHYNPGKNKFIDSVKMNAYGVYAEYRHHQKLIQMEQMLKQRGFKDGFRNVSDEFLVELGDIGEAYISTKEEKPKAGLLTTIKNMFQKITQAKIDENSELKIDRVLGEFSFDKKNPYRDPKFSSAVAEFQNQGLTQLDLKTELEDLVQSEDGRFFRNRVDSLDKRPIRKYGIHGIRA